MRELPGMAALLRTVLNDYSRFLALASFRLFFSQKYREISA